MDDHPAEMLLETIALRLVAQMAEREPVVYDLYGISRACAFCRREQWSKHVLEHADSCLWLACRRLAERATALGERTPEMPQVVELEPTT